MSPATDFSRPPLSTLTRRDALRSIALAAGGASSLLAPGTQTAAAEVQSRATSGLKQSIAHWCFARSPWSWTLERTCQEAVSLGCASVELLQPSQLSALTPYGLQCAMVSLSLPPGVRGFEAGWNNPENWEMLEAATRISLEAAAKAGAPSVIGFFGMKAKNLKNPAAGEFTQEEGADHCVEGLKKVAGIAEDLGVNLCVEMLNSRDGSAPMTGHPGYQGDHVDYCVRILERVASPRVKLLFDIYHVQIMDGDVIRRVRQYAKWIGHVHTAGVPGRGELDTQQEVYYPAVARALAGVGYQGYIGHEFMPTRDPVEGLREAVKACSGL